MDQPALFQSGDDFRLPARGGLYPLGENLAIVGVTESAGGHHACAIHGVALHGLVEAPQHFQGVRHGLGIKVAVAKDALAETCDFAILME